MSASAFARLNADIAALWNGKHAPKMSLSGSKIRLTHPFGHFVEIELTRGDLMGVPTRLTPALAELKQKAG